MGINKIWTLIVLYGIATDAELDLITDINGYSAKTLNDVIYVRTGYHSIEQYEKSELTS